MRLSIFVLCLVLFAAVAGKYKAEAAVRSAENKIERLKSDREAVAREVQLLRAEVAYLESPERLSLIANSVTSLQPLSGRQLLTADDFLASLDMRTEESGDTISRDARVTAASVKVVAIADAAIEPQR